MPPKTSPTRSTAMRTSRTTLFAPPWVFGSRGGASRVFRFFPPMPAAPTRAGYLIPQRLEDPVTVLQEGDPSCHGEGDVEDRDGGRLGGEVLQARLPGADLPVGDPLVHVTVDHRQGAPPLHDGLQPQASELRPPFLLLRSHRDVRRRVVGQEDRGGGIREEAIDCYDALRVLARDVREVPSLPPRRLVEGADGAHEAEPLTANLDDPGLEIGRAS